MRILFVSGTSVGGAARSTVELAELLAQRHHVVGVVLRDEAASKAVDRHKRLLNLRVKLARRHAPRPLVKAVEQVHRKLGAQRTPAPSPPGVRVWSAPLPENALRGALDDLRPDLVVVNSIERPAWRQIRDDLDARGIAHVLYLREATAVRHLTDPPCPPRLLLANAEAHAQAARELGFDCEVVPSVVDTSRCLIESTRTRVLLVNPIALYGVDRALALADVRRDIPFVFAESWPIPAEERARLTAAIDARPNVELRAYDPDPSHLYADARVLLMLCTVPSRPRVIAEAQANGIPVIATELAGHAEAVGTGGLLIDPDAPFAVWSSALDYVWESEVAYEELAQSARDHAARGDMRPEAVATRFEELVSALVGARSVPA